MTKLRLRSFSLILTFLFLTLPQSISAAELVTNGSFETGNFSGWTATNGAGAWVPWQVVTAGFNNGFSVPAAPQHGSFVAYEGVTGNAGATFTLVQQITIPAASTASLSWRHRFQYDNATYCSGAACGSATFAVEVLNSSNLLLETLHTMTVGPATIRNTGWQQYFRSLSAYAGQTIRIRFRTNVTATLSGPGQLEIDLVSAQSPSILAPTAATALISGRVLAPAGYAIGNAAVNLTDQMGATRTARTNAFGYFTLDAVEAGRTYFLSVSAKGWSFQPVVLNVSEDIAALEIFADDPFVKASQEITEPTPLKLELDREPPIFR
jgi:hypothetical protein